MRIAPLSLLLAVIVGTVPVSASAAVFQLGVQGGASVPTGDFADLDAETGFLFGVLGECELNDMWVVGANFSMGRNNHKDVGEVIDLGGGDTYTLDEDKYTTTQFGVHGKFMFPMQGPVRPFGIAGVGITSFKEEYTETYAFTGLPKDTQTYEQKTDSKFGGKIGGGATWWLTEMWGLGGEVDYNYVSEDGGSLTYIGLRATALVKLPGLK